MTSDTAPTDAELQALEAEAFALADGAAADAAWSAPLARLERLCADRPELPELRGLLAEVYEQRAFAGWTRVPEARDTGAVGLARRALNVAVGAEIEPGVYATTPAQVATAADCLSRMRALGIQGDSEHAEALAAIEAEVAAARRRGYQATWGETGIGALMVVVGLVLPTQPGPSGLVMGPWRCSAAWRCLWVGCSRRGGPTASCSRAAGRPWATPRSVWSGGTAWAATPTRSS